MYYEIKLEIMESITIDTLVLRFFQKISDWFQMKFGITNFHLAKIFLAGSLLFVCLMTLYIYRLKVIDILSITLIVTTFISQSMMFYKIEQAEWSCRTNPSF